MPRRRPDRTLWTPNQIVAFNVGLARLYRGWTQDQAAEAIAPYLGARLSVASWSAIERSVDGGRIREFNADEIVAFARGFELPVGWFLTPPEEDRDIWVDTPDTKGKGLPGRVLIDIVLGTPETLAAWEEHLLVWPAMGHRVEIGPDGTTTMLGRISEDVHPRLTEQARLQARLLIREQLGNLDQAADVLTRLTALLAELDQPAPPDTKRQPK